MLSRPLGALLAMFVGVAAASAQPVPPPGLSPDAFPPAGYAGPTGEPVLTGIGPEPYRWWLGAEYLLGFTRAATLPPLVTASPVGSGGVIGRPGTRVLVGGSQDFDGISGYRFGGGVWLDGCRAYALDWSAFFLPSQQAQGTFTAAPGQVLARPFFDTVLNTENSRVIASPGLFTGSVTTSYSTQFYGAEAGALLRVVETPTFSLEQLFHFRFYALDESVRSNDTSTALGGGVVAFNGAAFGPPATVTTSDTFRVLNRWYGGSAGVRFNWTPGRWEVKLAGRLGVGAVEQNVDISGRTTLSNTAAGGGSIPLGFYSTSQPSGRATLYRLSFAPDVQLRVGYRVTDWLMLSAGYQYLYISDVARAADVVDRRLNTGRIPSGQNFGAAAPALPASPNVPFSDFHLHGLTAGLMITF